MLTCNFCPFGRSEVNTYLVFISKLANQRARKALFTVAHNCHSKRNNFAAKEITSRPKKKTRGKRKNLAAKRNVRNNSKTSRWFLLISSVTSCNWFLAVTKKSFGIAIYIKDVNLSHLNSVNPSIQFNLEREKVRDNKLT